MKDPEPLEKLLRYQGKHYERQKGTNRSTPCLDASVPGKVRQPRWPTWQHDRYTQTRWQELYCFQDCLWWSIHLEVDNGHEAVYDCWRQTVTPVRPQGQEACHVSHGWAEIYTRRTLRWAGWSWEMNFVVTRIYNKMMTILSVMTETCHSVLTEKVPLKIWANTRRKCLDFRNGMCSLAKGVW